MEITRTGRLLAVALIVAISLCLGIPRAAAQGGTAGVCFCDERGGIGIAQLIGAVNVALGTADCPGSPPAEAIAQGQVGIAGVCFCDASGTIAISQLIRAVSVALGVADCAITPTIPTPTSTPATPTVDSYGDCRAGGPCAPGEFCFTNGDSAVCVPQGCGVVADCPARPPRRGRRRRVRRWSWRRPERLSDCLFRWGDVPDRDAMRRRPRSLHVGTAVR